MNQDTSKQLLKLLLRVSVTSLLLWMVLRKHRLEDLGRALVEARWPYVVGIWVMALLALWISACRLRLILKKLECHVQTHKIFRASLASVLYSLVLPGFLSTGVKWYILKEDSRKGSHVLSGMVYNQITDILTRLLFAWFAVVWVSPGLHMGERLVGLAIGGCLTVVAVGLVNPRVAGALTRILRFCVGLFPRFLRHRCDILLGQLEVFQSEAWRFHGRMALLSMTIGVLSFAIYICAAQAAQIQVPLSTCIWLSSLVYLLGRVPISLANLGVRENTLVFFLSFHGIASLSALLMSFVLFSQTLFLAVLGIVLQLVWVVWSGKNRSK